MGSRHGYGLCTWKTAIIRYSRARAGVTAGQRNALRMPAARDEKPRGAGPIIYFPRRFF